MWFRRKQFALSAVRPIGRAQSTGERRGEGIQEDLQEIQADTHTEAGETARKGDHHGQQLEHESERNQGILYRARGRLLYSCL